eukprot:COSAG01_NODE_316_length_19004_cov_100.001322_9_plen_123_part_00
MAVFRSEIAAVDDVAAADATDARVVAGAVMAAAARRQFSRGAEADAEVATVAGGDLAAPAACVEGGGPSSLHLQLHGIEGMNQQARRGISGGFFSARCSRIIFQTLHGIVVTVGGLATACWV